VIPVCTASPDFNPTHNCSTGGITFWTDEGRAIYNGLLAKLTQRPMHRFSYVVSYALQKATTTNVVDDANWFRGYGEYLPHHNLTVSGTLTLPVGFTLSLNSFFISKTPVAASVNGLFLPGWVPHQSVTGTITTPLPGVAYSCFNAGCGQADLQKAVDAYNSTVVGTKDAKGQTIAAPLVLPSDYQFGDSTFTQDLRLTKVFTYKERYKLSILGEIFNMFNIANLSGYSFNLDTKAATSAAQTFAFGQPTQRINQTFGSGGPRAFQVGARFSF
jgi:hypothetical protein